MNPEPTSSGPEFHADQLTQRLCVIIPTDADGIGRAVDGLMQIVREMGCAEGKENEIEISLREAISGAVAGAGEAQTSVEICAECDETQGMLLIVRNPDSFDPRTAPAPFVGQLLHSEHGRGLYLINRLMDEVQFRAGGTEIRMRKKS